MERLQGIKQEGCSIPGRVLPSGPTCSNLLTLAEGCCLGWAPIKVVKQGTVLAASRCSAMHRRQ